MKVRFTSADEALDLVRDSEVYSDIRKYIKDGVSYINDGPAIVYSFPQLSYAIDDSQKEFSCLWQLLDRELGTADNTNTVPWEHKELVGYGFSFEMYTCGTGDGSITRKGQRCYQFTATSYAEAAGLACEIIHKFNNHTIQFHKRNYVKDIMYRRVWYKGQAAVIGGYLNMTSKVCLYPVSDEFVGTHSERNAAFLFVDILSPDIDWHREGEPFATKECLSTILDFCRETDWTIRTSLLGVELKKGKEQLVWRILLCTSVPEPLYGPDDQAVSYGLEHFIDLTIDNVTTKSVAKIIHKHFDIFEEKIERVKAEGPYTLND